MTIFGPIIAFFWPSNLETMPSEPISIGDEGSIPVGDSKTVRFGRYPAMVINTDAKGLVAYSAVCTHFACIVYWNPESGMIECPCHAGFYDPLDGSVISGPPPAPLEKLDVSIEDSKIFIGAMAITILDRQAS
jgi:Rieske Fe-S protein